MVVLTLLQQLMVGRDLIAEMNATRERAKQRFRDGFAEAAAVAHWSRGADLPGWAREAGAAIAVRVPAHQRSVIEEAGPAFGGRIERRSRALLLLIELVAFQPWSGGVSWVPAARRDALAAVAGHLSALRPGGLSRMSSMRSCVALTRRNVRWGRVAAVSAAGLVLGVASMGVAAPVIGAAVGGVLGLSGAAATSPVDVVRPSSTTSLSICRKIRYSSRSDTSAICPTTGDRRSPLVSSMCHVMEPRRIHCRIR